MIIYLITNVISEKKLKKVFIFSYCANKHCNSNVTFSEVEISCNFSKAVLMELYQLASDVVSREGNAALSQFRQLLLEAKKKSCMFLHFLWLLLC